MIVSLTDRFQFYTSCKLKSESIEVVKQMKVLGTIFTGRLSWNENSDSIVKKLNARMQWIKRKIKSPLQLPRNGPLMEKPSV